MFYANKAYLTKTVDANGQNAYTSRTIYSGPPDSSFTKPSKTFASTMFISVLIAVQVLSLVLLVLYIYSAPTWDTGFYSLAILRLDADIEKECLGSLGSASNERAKRLMEIDGLKGIGAKGVDLGQRGIVGENAMRRGSARREV